MNNFVKLKDYEAAQLELSETHRKIIILAQAITDVRSELTTKNPDKDWCIDKICIALDKIETKPTEDEKVK